MMQDADIVVAINVGTSKVCTIVARREDAGGFSIPRYLLDLWDTALVADAQPSGSGSL